MLWRSHQQMQNFVIDSLVPTKIYSDSRGPITSKQKDSQRPDRVFRMTMISPNLVKIFPMVRFKFKLIHIRMNNQSLLLLLLRVHQVVRLAQLVCQSDFVLICPWYGSSTLSQSQRNPTLLTMLLIPPLKEMYLGRLSLFSDPL